MVSFSCPKCRKVLKSNNPIPDGKKIKCPACTHVFTFVATDTAIQTGKPPAMAPKPGAQAVKQGVPGKARKAVVTDEDDEEDEEPVAPKKRKRKRRVAITL